VVDGEVGGLYSLYLRELDVLSLDGDRFLSFNVIDVMSDEISHDNKNVINSWFGVLVRVGR
jgi:hypothetical protein